MSGAGGVRRSGQDRGELVMAATKGQVFPRAYTGLPGRLLDFVACKIEKRFVCKLVLGKSLLRKPLIGQDLIYLLRCCLEGVLVFGNDGHLRLGYEKLFDSIRDLFLVTLQPSRCEFIRCPQVCSVDIDADVLYLSGSLLFEPFLSAGIGEAPTDEGTSDPTENT